MRKLTTGLASVAMIATTLAVGAQGAPTASAAPPEDPTVTAGSEPAATDDLPNPKEEKRRELREAGLRSVLNGEAKATQRGASTVVKVGEAQAPGGRNGETVDQYAELSRQTTDKIFTILVQFGNDRHPSYPDQDTDPSTPGPARFNGPLHNRIPEPDRSVDNSTIWQADYSRDHFKDLYFGASGETVKTYYEAQSSGRYSVEGRVSPWVKVRYNEARYGRSNGFPCDDVVCDNTWFLIRDAVNQWVANEHRLGVSDAQIAAKLAPYDVWDRNDFDADGDFNEPDGYIDHFQIVHAGGDQADGDPWQGEDAIWSHRWKAFQETGQGPPENPDGGTQIGTTGLWVADYTIQPENGAISVFAHEYAHDLGLPDLYDFAGDNAVNWWSIMGQSRVSAADDAGIGTRAADLGPWEKLQLGWFDYEIVVAGQRRTLELGPHEYKTQRAQGAVVVLPKKEVETEFGEPYEGDFQWWSDTGNDLDNTMSRDVTLPAGTAELTFQARWNIEDCGSTPCDYAYVEVDDGSGWSAVPGSITNPAEGNGIDGVSNGWELATFDLSSYAGSEIGLRMRYRTDGAAAGTDPDETPGLFADDIAVTANGTTVFADGAEDGANGWTLDGFRAVGASETTEYDNYYIASNRQYVSFDRYLRTGPYNFGFLPDRPDWTEHFPYQSGLLVWYWDTSFSDNNESQHPGRGEILPIDAHPRPIYNLQGVPWRGRIQTYDAPFSLRRPDSFTLHLNNQPSYIRGKLAQPVFDDSRTYWWKAQPTVGVKVPNAGVRIEVLNEQGATMRIHVGPS